MVADGSLDQLQVDRIFADADAAAGNAPKLALSQAKPSGPKSLDTVMREAMLAKGLISTEDAAADEAREAAGLDHDADASSAQRETLGDEDDSPLDATMASAFDPPATPSDYSLPMVPDYDPKLGNAFRELAHAAGFDQVLARTVYDAHNDAAARGQQTPEALAKQATDNQWQMRRMWGSSFDTNIEFARAEVRRVEAIAPGTVAYLETMNLADDPRLVAAFASRGMARSGSKA